MRRWCGPEPHATYLRRALQTVVLIPHRIRARLIGDNAGRAGSWPSLSVPRSKRTEEQAAVVPPMRGRSAVDWSLAVSPAVGDKRGARGATK